MAIHAELEKVRQVFMHIEPVKQGGRYVHVIDKKMSRPFSFRDQPISTTKLFHLQGSIKCGPRSFDRSMP